MGGCIGKKSSKYLNRNLSQSDVALAPQTKEQKGMVGMYFFL